MYAIALVCLAACSTSTGHVRSSDPSSTDTRAPASTITNHESVNRTQPDATSSSVSPRPSSTPTTMTIDGHAAIYSGAVQRTYQFNKGITIGPLGNEPT